MAEYKDVYSFEVVDRMLNCEDVYCVDREKQEVIEIKCMEVEEFIELKKLAEEQRTRFAFWVKSRKE